MSYCRWSSMNWMCDVYVYEDVAGGFTTHVASRRRAIPPIPDIIFSKFATKLYRWSGCDYDRTSKTFIYPSKTKKLVYSAWNRFLCFWHSNIHGFSLHIIPLLPIGLPHDGESFNDETAGECADRLERLMKIGYKVPKVVIETLRSEDDICDDQTDKV